MSQKKLLDLKILREAKLCSSDCKHVHEDGQVEKMVKESMVFCVGCGRGCHMPCHNVPDAIVNAVKTIPKNNRAKAYFGEMSYIRLVCDNCANLLITNASPDVRPSFLSMFNAIAKERVELNGTLNMETETIEKEANSDKSSQRGKKRKGDEMDDNDNTLVDMKRLLDKCIIKINQLEKSTDNVNTIVSQNSEKLDKLSKSENELKSTVSKKLNNVEKSMKTVELSLDANGQTLVAINEKMDKNVLSIDDGMQKGFNKLADLQEKLYSPATPMSNNRNGNFGFGSSIRRAAITNRARNYQNGTPTSANFGPAIPTESGASNDESLFGPAVPRKINFNVGENQNNAYGTKKEFRYEDAIYIRYVDPSITPHKMNKIMMKNETIKKTIEQNPDAVEITRLVKKRWTEDEIKQRRFGISYRIGCSPDIFALIKDKQLWATHWEIRLWDKDFGKHDQNFRDQAQMDHQK